MTEQEWLECQDPEKVLAFLSGKINERQLLLICCGCARRALHMMDFKWRKDMEHCELYVDKKITYAEMMRRQGREEEANSPPMEVTVQMTVEGICEYWWLVSGVGGVVEEEKD